MGLTRRDFLRYGGSAGAIALTTSLGGCSRPKTSVLRVRVLQGSMPIQLPKKFSQRLRLGDKSSFTFIEKLAQPGVRLQHWVQGKNRSRFTQARGLSQSFSLLQRWSTDPATIAQHWTSHIPNPLQRPDRPADLITLGDSWLTAAILQDLIEPLDPAEFPRWQELPGRWQQLMQRDATGFLQADGPVWAAPYRWGSNVIAYRKSRIEKLGIEINDWEDLWNPKLKGLVSLPDSPREVIGLALKKLGQSYNHPNPSQVEGLAEALASLHDQVKLYASDNYLQPLLLEDTWVAVGSSAELLPLLQRDRNLAIIFPSSGSSLWADLWVKPKPFMKADAPAVEAANDLASRWIDFCWSPEVVKLITNLSNGASPLALEPGLDWLDKLQNRDLLLPEESALRESEFILPLPQTSLDQYQDLWVKMRQTALKV